MAQTNYQKRCPSCGGDQWEYVRELKLWRCLFCDSQVERREQHDERYAVNNVIRQAILDSAYRRMEQADRNLSECQKLDVKYIGTLIAGICCRMIAAVSGRYLGGQDPRSLLGQIRRDYLQLNELDEVLGVDETELYEFLDSSDAWAVLAMVFDTLGDEQRCEYLLKMTALNQVFSKETNKSLLRFALKNNRIDLAEEVLSNRRNVDITDALDVVLSSCPDGEPKARMVASLIRDGAVRDGDVTDLEAYMSSADGASTKAAIACAACNAGLNLRLDLTIQEALSTAELSKFKELIGALFKRRLNDAEVEQLLGLAERVDDPEKAMAVLDALAASGQFVSINGKQVQAFVFKTSISPEHRIEMIERLRGFTGTDRMWETVTGAYLCQVSEPAENRAAILDALCAELKSVPAKDFERYVLTCNADGQEKTQRIRQLLSLPNMNVGFFRGLAGQYIQSNKDDPAHRTRILYELLECGLAIDASVLLDFLCAKGGTVEDKLDLLQLVQKNGTVLRSDAVGTYLERCADTFDHDLFAALYRSNAVVSPKALENYVLVCDDFPHEKAETAFELSRAMSASFGSTDCRIKFRGSKISCSLAQAYILLTEDNASLAADMLQRMTNSGTKLTTTIVVDGISKKFNKFVQENRAQLSPVAEELCQIHRLFSRFF